MLRLQRAQAPSEWRARHLALAQAHGGWATEAAGFAGGTWASPRWIDHAREETYHLLCADAAGSPPQALASAVKAAEYSAVRARQWAGLITDAGRDADQPELRQWGRRLQGGIREDDLTGYLTHLISNAQLDKTSLTIALENRSEGYRLAGRYDESLADLNQIIGMDPGYARAFASRGLTYYTMSRHDEAIADFSRADNINPGYAWAISNRGRTYWAIERHDDALADFSRAIDIDPGYAKALGSRGLGYLVIGRYDEALAARAFGEGERSASVAEWRAGHERFWHLAAIREALGDLQFAVDDDTPVVAQSFRLAERR